MDDGVVIQLIGNVDPQTSAVRQYLKDAGESFVHTKNRRSVLHDALAAKPDLIIVAGWRHLLPKAVLAVPRLGVVGFHSAKLPEYPGRAPVPWTLLRGDAYAYNTMLFLDEGVDTGDIIDFERTMIADDESPLTLYDWMASTDVRMLKRNLPLLKEGAAPRTPQDMTKRGPVTTKDGWMRWQLSQF